MTVVIMTDIEGISGVDDISMIDESGEGYRFACAQLMKDTNAAVAGCFDGGATRVLVIDGHGAAHNMDAKKLDPRAEKITVQQWIEVTRAGEVDLFMEIGAHAKPGTQDAFLDHVQSSAKWFEYTINGVSCGELTQGGLFMGAYGVPFVMVSGDEAACAEARALLDGRIACAVVKRGIGRNRAECIGQDEALLRIRRAACEAMKLGKVIPPLRVPTPLDIRLVHMRSDYCDETMERHPDFARLDARTAQRIVQTVESYSDLLFW